ncbi:MAG: hypothetical protein RL386_1270 [Bacteroidota bacterium]
MRERIELAAAHHAIGIGSYRICPLHSARPGKMNLLPAMGQHTAVSARIARPETPGPVVCRFWRIVNDEDFFIP